jgi:hypothetical protein
MPPHPHLVEKINALILSSMSVQQNNQTATVLLSSDAQRLMDDLTIYGGNVCVLQHLRMIDAASPARFKKY